MQDTLVRSAIVTLAALIGMAVMGCDRSCAFYFTCEETGSAGAAGGGTAGEGGGSMVDRCPQDPAEGPTAPDCGVWVAPSWGDDANEGTQGEPVATLAQAIARAGIGTGRVYACGETFAETVELPAGVSLAGGFSCERGVWLYEGKDRPAILAPPLPVLSALTVLPGEHLSMLTDLQVEAPDAIAPGASSIAVLTRNGARATIKRSHFIAGNGADGQDGEDGDHNGALAQPGLPGNDGANACVSAPGLGGLAVKIECDGAVTLGGSGGDGGELFATDGTEGLQPPDPNPQGYGAPGVAQDVAQGTSCTPGYSGKHGNSGIDGAGAVGLGTLSDQGYVGDPGADGWPGTPGQGGGGGGGSIGSAICGGLPHGGAGGGSGGSGGCGGKPGKGGQGGGSSIALVVLGPGITLVETQVTVGNGGKGGNGGASQLGGQGGLPGPGGFGFGGANGLQPGCPGGVGGKGGNGGNGGGGRGGHSLGIAILAGAQPAVDEKHVYNQGAEGVGGKGGNPDLRGSGGQLGVSADARTFFP